jgi:indole-3-glycerol phosphate synthase
MTTTADLLQTIVAATRTAVAVRERLRPLSELELSLRQRAARGDAFASMLRDSAAPRIIAECKRRSPSRGILRADYDPAAHAFAYEHYGAAAISVLTEPTFFDGAPEHLAAVRRCVTIPVLRKDFIVTAYQVHESAALGADAILLIVGALSDAELRDLLATAASLRLAALVEVHTREELQRALAAGARIVGVNSRNLRTLSVEPGVFEELAPAIPREAIAVAESGIRTGDDLKRFGALGFSAFLVGERLIAEPDPGLALERLRTS